jgi:hypothetical protein
MEFPVQKGWKETRDTARRFLWHVSNKRFNHQHWWVQQPAETTPEAAMWEAMRRHPDVQRIMRRRYHRYPGGSRAFFERACRFLSRNGVGAPLWTLPEYVGSHARKPWPQLSKAEKMDFAERLKAVSPRYRTFCTPPGVLLTEDMLLGQDIGDLLRQQHLPIVVDLNADPATVVRWVEQMVKEHRKGLKPPDRRRAHVSEWLGVIRLFEKEEMERQPKQRRNDKAFARYRRVIQESWPPDFHCLGTGANNPP